MDISCDEHLVALILGMDPPEILALQEEYAQKGKEQYAVFLESGRVAYKRREAAWVKVDTLLTGNVGTGKNAYKNQIQLIVKERLEKLQKKYPSKTIFNRTDIYGIAGFEENDVRRYLYNEEHRGSKKYRDAHLRLIFLLEMDYQQAEEFTILVDQRLDKRVRRDYLLMECIANKVYAPKEVNDHLRTHNDTALFDEWAEEFII